MHIVIFGLTVSSSWGNGHATLWRSLIKAMLRRGHTVRFFERDVPYYAGARDLTELPTGAKLVLCRDLADTRVKARQDLQDADLAICTSFCPDGAALSELVLDSHAGLKAFYDLDTPVTLDGLRSGQDVGYVPARGLGDFDVVLSYTGGRALQELQTQLHARLAVPLYGSVDPENHFPVLGFNEPRADLSYLGTYAEDRQQGLEMLFLRPAAEMPTRRFLIGGAQYPQAFPWLSNVYFSRHVPPPMHPSFYAQSRATLNVTRRAMADYGYCPSGRLFEAAACSACLLTDTWEGLDTFFAPGSEMIEVHSSADVVQALSLSDTELAAIGRAARERALADHTGEKRVQELELICERARSGAQKAHAGQ